MVSEGNIGLMKAIKNFKIESGCKIATYAVWWIKAAIHEYIIKSWSIVKIGTTASQRKLFFNLRKLKNSILSSNKDLNDCQIIDQISKKLDVKKRDVRDMDTVLCGHDVSLNAPLKEDGAKEVHEMISSKEENQEITLVSKQDIEVKKKLLTEAVQSLEPRYKKIFLLRTKNDSYTLKKISEMFCISQERVRQIHARAMEKVKEYIKENGKKFGIQIT